MFVLIITWSSLNVGRVGSKTRSLGRIFIKPSSLPRDHSFLLSSYYFTKMSDLMIFWSSLNMGHVGSDVFKTLF